MITDVTLWPLLTTRFLLAVASLPALTISAIMLGRLNARIEADDRARAAREADRPFLPDLH